jgi:hypothetical protein
MSSSVYDAQPTTLYCPSLIWLAALNVDIPVNTREYFSSTEFGPLSMYIIAEFKAHVERLLL